MKRMNRSSELEDCIEKCMDCYKSCTETMAHCLDMGGKHAESSHMSMMMDCAEICNISADFMLRDSNMSAAICEKCAEICDICAEDCKSFKDDTEMMQCADMCVACAESCRKMVGQSSDTRFRKTA